MVAPTLKFDISARSNITDYSFWAMDLDGLIAYDRDASQIDSFQVAEGNTRVVTKESYWTTAGLHGSEWRLVVTKIIQ